MEATQLIAPLNIADMILIHARKLDISNYKPLRYLKGNSADRVLLVKNQTSNDLSVIKIHKNETEINQIRQLYEHLYEEIDILSRGLRGHEHFPFWSKCLGVIFENQFTGVVLEFVSGESLKSLAQRLGVSKISSSKII